MVAAAVIGSAVVGTAGSALSANAAAGAEKSASSQATAAQEQMFNTAQTNAQTDFNTAQNNDLTMYNNASSALNPYITAGNSAESSYLNQLNADLPGLTAPVTMDQSTLENTPGYQFTLGQGLESVQNSAAARGLASSGAALKGAAEYATGLADTTYQQQFTNAITNKQQTLSALNALLPAAELGGNAAGALASAATGEASNVTSAANQNASTVANAATTTGSNVGSNITGAGNATAAADTSIGNSLTSGLSSVGNLYLTNSLMQGMYGNSNPLGLPGAGASGNTGSTYSGSTMANTATGLEGLT